MRILIVDVNFDYKNPMYRQFYNSLFYCMEVDYFGPGYVTRESLEKGIEDYLYRHEKYDAILLGTYFVYSTGEGGTRYHTYEVHRYTIPYYNVNDAYQCCGRIFQELKKIDGPIKIYVYYEDNASMTIGDFRMCQSLLEQNFYILSWPKEYMKIFPAQMMRKYQLTNYAYELIEKNEKKYIPLTLHGINSNEIFVRDFASREFDWCVPGNRLKTSYPERNKAHEMLREQGKKIWNDDPYQKLSVFSIERGHLDWYHFRNKFEKMLSLYLKKNLNISSFPQMCYIGACREHYLESMRASKYVYAEGGMWNCFVQKYFEACASGALLVAKSVPGLSEMGIVHEKNCVIVERYEEIIYIDKKYSEKRIEEMAKAGQQLILDKHMFHYRALALEKTIEMITEGNYEGAYWLDGDYVLV